MPRLHAEALLFGLAWAALAVAGGLLIGWVAGALLSAGLLVVVVPASTITLARTDSLRAERLVRWGIWATAVLALALLALRK